MEKYNELPTEERESPMDAHEKNTLVSEHALFVARLSRATDDIVRREIGERLKEIEQALQLSPQEIARLAVQQYKKQY